jgi:hypothetical protein
MNVTPTITADLLTEYLVSPPLRRQHLLERAKYPALSLDRWAPARALARDVMLGRRDEIDVRLSDAPGSDVLAAFFSRDWERIRADREVVEVPELAAAPLEVSGVEITGCGPDVLLSCPRGQWTRFDGLALAFSPTSEADARVRCALMAVALGRGSLGQWSHISQDGCTVFDLVGGRAIGGTHRWGDIVAACDEVRRMWSTV